MRVPSNAVELILFQRTDLLPPRRVPLTARVLRKFGLLKEDYEQFVRNYAAKNVELVTRQYSERMETEFRRIREFLPKAAASVLDIGCGIAGLDVFVYEHLRENDPTMHLLDKTATEDRVWYDFKACGAFYNSLEIARETLIANGVPPQKVNTITAPDDGKIALPSGSIDLVLSTISWGFHYPVEVYIDSVFDLLSQGGVLLLDVRKGTTGLELLQNRFENRVEIVSQGNKFDTARCIR